jgi:single-strand DNA-binding protein
MAEGLNRVMLLGSVGQDPELRVLNNGGTVLTIRLATNERVKVRDEWKEQTEWHSVVVFGSRAEALSRLLSKGSKIFVEGSLQTRSWEDRGGNKRWKTEIKAQKVIFAGGGPKRNEEWSPYSEQGSHKSGEGEIDDDEDYKGSVFG